MPTREERLRTFQDGLHRITTEGGDENFVVFEEVESGRFVQFASRRGERAAIMDVPVASQDLGDDARRSLESLGFEAEQGVGYEVDEEVAQEANADVKAGLHEWILDGRDPDHPHVPELVTRRVLRRVQGGAQESYQAIVDADRGALLAERVFRDVLGAPDDYRVFVELDLS